MRRPLSSFCITVLIACCLAIPLRPDQAIAATGEYSDADFKGFWRYFALITAETLTGNWYFGSQTFSGTDGSYIASLNNAQGVGFGQFNGKLTFTSNGRYIETQAPTASNGIMNSLKNLGFAVFSNSGDHALQVMVRSEGAFKQSDLTGGWYLASLCNGNQTEWQFYDITYDSLGWGSGTLYRSGGSPSPFSTIANLTLFSDGRAALGEKEAFRASMSSDKTFLVMADVSNGVSCLTLGVKKSDKTFKQSDFAGTWDTAWLSDAPSEAWYFGSYQVPGSGKGTATRSLATSSGSTFTTPESWPFTLNADGTIGGGTSLGAMNSDKNIFLIVQNTSSGSPRIQVWVKRQYANRKILKGKVTYGEIPVCAMVLVNGKFQFSCGGEGGYELRDIPLNDQGKMIVQIFASGLKPIKKEITPTATLTELNQLMTLADPQSMSIQSLTATKTSATRARVSGTVTYQGSPVCSMVLINGQHMFTCDGTGAFDLDVPLDSQGQVTVQTFVSGLAPYRETLTPN